MQSETTPDGGSHRTVTGAALAVAAAAFVVAVAGSALAALSTRQLSGAQHATSVRDQALAAARQIAVDFAAYDYRNLAADFKRVADESTGTFHSQYVTQSTGVHDLIVKAKAVSTAEVAGAGVVESTGSQATVVIALNRVVRNTSVPNGQNDSFGLQIVLMHTHGQWLASQVKPL